MTAESRPGKGGSHKTRLASEADSTAELPPWSSVETLAAWLDLDVKALRWARYQGKAPRAHKIAGKLRFRREDVLAWIAERAES
jgi:Helix-turn-helix domain